MSLLASKGRNILGGTPLAERMRPRSLEEVVGQPELLERGRPLREAVEADTFSALIFWGPPGAGKTTVARLVASRTACRFVPFSAVLSGIREVRQVMDAAADERRLSGRPTVVFVDELHRFNRAQQDAFLPRVEAGDVRLVGATTENPSFEVVAPLLSRAQVHRFQALPVEALEELLQRALADTERGLGASGAKLAPAALRLLAEGAGGDARQALSLLEQAVVLAGSRPVAGEAQTSEAGPGGAAEGEAAGLREGASAAAGAIEESLVLELLGTRAVYHDRAGDRHFDLLSALQKSIRNSDADAAIYWLQALLDGGEDLMLLARRLVRIASEDVGLAAPELLARSLAARDAAHFLGRPEGELALLQIAVELAAAPKSDALVRASRAARRALAASRPPVPLALRNAPTRLLKELGSGAGYRHAHDQPEGVGAMECLPGELGGTRFLELGRLGFEKDLARRLAWWRRQRATASRRERDERD